MAVQEKRGRGKAGRKSNSNYRSNRATRYSKISPPKSDAPFEDVAVFSSRRQNIMVSLLLATAISVIYFPVLRDPFINYDDDVYVTKNLHVNTGLTWENFRWAWTSLAGGNWHPLTWLSHAMDCQIFGLYAGGHHLINVLLHSLNAVLLFWLLQRVTQARWRSAMVAALFSLHPLNVESVAWVAERKNLLCTLFFLLALAAYGWYVQHPQVKRYLGVAAWFVLGLASKPMVITLPLVLLLIDYWPLGRIEGWTPPSPTFPVEQEKFTSLLLEKLPLLVLSAASAVVTLIAQNAGGAIRSFSDFPFRARLENTVFSYALYLEKALWPSRLAVYYPFPEHGIEHWQIGVAVVCLLALSAFIWRKRSPYLVFGWLLFLGALVPVSGLVQVGGQAMADRYAYIPLLGIFVTAIWGAAACVENRHLGNFACAVSCATLLVVFGTLSWLQLGHWRSSTDLWAQAASVTNDNFVAEKNLANALLQLNRIDDALPHLQNAIRINPEDVACHVNLGGILQRHGDWQGAILQYAMAVQIGSGQNSPSSKQAVGLAYASLGSIYGQRGDYVNALANYWQAAQVNPNVLDPFLAGVSRLVTVPLPAQGYLQLGQLLQQSHRMGEAEVAYQEALKLDSTSPARSALQELRDRSESE